jgi:hypothetical protein
MAPERFSWRRYQHPDKDIVRVSLSDAKKKKYGELTRGSGDEGWMLTTNGVRWVERNIEALRRLDGGPSRSRLDVAADQELRQLRQHELFAQWKERSDEVPSPYEVADLVQLPADAPEAAVAEGMARLENLSLISGDEEIKEFLSWAKTGTSR